MRIQRITRVTRLATALVVVTALAPCLSAQVARQTLRVVVTDTVVVAAPRVTAGAPRRPLILGGDESLRARAFDASRTHVQSFVGNLTPALGLDSIRATERRGHVWLGAALGLGIGAGAGYLVAIPRVRATERNSDGPFQQIEYLFDPVIGGVIGSVVGVLVGSHVR